MKSPMVGLRLPEDVKTKLDQIAAGHYDLSTSQIARTAITEWVEAQWMRNADIMLIPKGSFLDLLSLLTPDKLEEFEEKIALKVHRYFEFLTIERRNQIVSLKDFISEMVKFIGSSGLRWFDQMTIETDPMKPPLFFKGMHSMGRLWSQVFMDIFTKILLKYPVQFKIIQSSIILNESLVYFEMK
jgi:hypothetical protein